MSPTSVWNTEVETPGDYIVFDVPGMDHYKVSLVQEIEQVETEVVSIYKTIGSGETHLVDVLNKTSLAGIQAILNSHSESTLLSVGDEVTVNIGGLDEIYIIGGIDVYGTHEVLFISKYVTSQSLPCNGDYADLTEMNQYLSNIYTNMNASDRILLKDRSVQYVNGSIKYITQKIWIPSRWEVFGHGPETQSVHLPYFTYEANKRRYTKEGSNSAWMLRTRQTVYSGYTDYVGAGGGISYTNGNLNILPCFHLTADV